MFTAMDRIRVRTMEALRQVIPDPERLTRVSAALHQILDIELAIMLETYREDLLAKHRSAERLSTIGQFAAGIGHELRNPLGVMESSVFLMRQRLAQIKVDDPVLQKHLDKVAGEVQRSNRTINELLELARNRPPRRRTLPVRAIVEQAVAATTLPAGVTVERDIPPDLSLDCDPDQIGRVLSNLLINASQAMNGSGHIWIGARRIDTGTTLVVRDDGPGVPADVRHRIFEALFTTKAKGSGLGLALCRQIAQAHGGSIVLERSEKGASFLLTVPDGAAEGS
jgi:signal transduction histidine kinase